MAHCLGGTGFERGGHDGRERKDYGRSRGHAPRLPVCESLRCLKMDQNHRDIPPLGPCSTRPAFGWFQNFAPRGVSFPSMPRSHTLPTANMDEPCCCSVALRLVAVALLFALVLLLDLGVWEELAVDDQLDRGGLANPKDAIVKPDAVSVAFCDTEISVLSEVDDSRLDGTADTKGGTGGVKMCFNRNVSFILSLLFAHTQQESKHSLACTISGRDD
eukprot:scaffold114797_cov51-Attheya_sp.AAC.8